MGGSVQIQHSPSSAPTVAPVVAQQQQLPTYNVGGVDVPTISYTDFIARLDPRALNTEQYTYGRCAPRNGPLGDRTSFVTGQHGWGPARVNRPSVLFQLYPPVGRVMLDPGLLFTPTPSTAFSQLQIVVDRDGQPLRNFSELPIVISTNVEGWLVEAWMRSNLHIRHEDILQRMPYLADQKWFRRNNGGGFKNTISGRRRDFRKIGRCLSWEPNTGHRSPFDRRILDEVRSNPLWTRDQTTQYLNDLTKQEREALEKTGKRKRSGAEDAQSPDTSKNLDEPESLEGCEEDQKVRLGIDFRWIEEDIRLRREAVSAGMPSSLDPLPKTWDPPFRRPSVPREFTAHLLNDHRAVLPESPDQNTTPSVANSGVQSRVSSGPLLTGRDLVSWLDQRGIVYQPSNRLPVAAPEQQDARFAPAMSSEERRQLFLALYPAVLAAAVQMSRPMTVDLSISYAVAYNSLQDQLVHSSYMDDNTEDLERVEQRLTALSGWTGEISAFDLVGLEGCEVEDAQERETRKLRNAPYSVSETFQEKILQNGMLDEQSSLLWPNKLVIEADFDLSANSGWRLQLVDYE